MKVKSLVPQIKCKRDQRFNFSFWRIRSNKAIIFRLFIENKHQNRIKIDFVKVAHSQVNPSMAGRTHKKVNGIFNSQQINTRILNITKFVFLLLLFSFSINIWWNCSRSWLITKSKWNKLKILLFIWTNKKQQKKFLIQF